MVLSGGADRSICSSGTSTILTPRSRARSRAEGVTMVPGEIFNSPDAGTSAAMMTGFTRARRFYFGYPAVAFTSAICLSCRSV